ncbi:hypothetical protein GXP67_26640 [Rhodocytophaga rosea]|uniref:Uncharacterized protein n=1 Tax=Rhodocytophaga rosea TaxID=2704465 RepID=A0A6C0GPI8_9BACT|nr:hypothetical protein [Rhodocytophaga rosea]QHT69968.1 hypothetical protein GXP67_26640 [Rhodocytophaga rosea]
MNKQETDRLDIVIVIFNSQLQDHTQLAHQIESLSQEVAPIGNACAYVPKIKKTQEILSLLEHHQVKFGLHQNNGSKKKEIEEK